MNSFWGQIVKICLVCCIFWCVFGTISKPSEKKTKKEKSSKIKLSSQTVHERSLILKDLKPNDVVANYANYCKKTSLKSSSVSPILGYVTPWNSHGYDVAKTFNKFHMISPVWLQIKRKPGGKYHVTGTHDIDNGWIRDVRKLNPEIKILPRVLFDGWTYKDFVSLFSSEDEIEDMIEVLSDTLISNLMNGMVLELWSRLPPNSVK